MAAQQQFKPLWPAMPVNWSISSVSTIGAISSGMPCVGAPWAIWIGVRLPGGMDLWLRAGCWWAKPIWGFARSLLSRFLAELAVSLVSVGHVIENGLPLVDYSKELLECHAGLWHWDLGLDQDIEPIPHGEQLVVCGGHFGSLGITDHFLGKCLKGFPSLYVS